MKFSVAAIAVSSIVGCGGAAKSFSAKASTGNSGSSAGTSATSGSGTANSTAQAGTSASSASAAAPSAPAGPQATVITDLQSKAGWQMCGGCGNAGGVGQGPDYNLAQGVVNPSLSGKATDFFLNGGPAYTGGYYFLQLPTMGSPLSSLRYDADIFIPGQYANAPQGIEFECQQTVNGATYNFAWQADYASNTWRVFNYTTKTWEPTGIQLQRFAPDTWHHVAATFHTAGTQAVHDTLIVDGQTYNVNIGHEATQTGDMSQFTTGFQLDLNSSSTPYHVFVDNMQITVAD